MHRKNLVGLTLLIALAVCLLSQAAMGATIEGAWMGKLKVPGGELRIVFKIVKGSDGALTATMDSPDQGATGIPVDEVTWDKGHLHLGMKALTGVFEGDLKSDQASIEGTWTQGGTSFPLVLAHTDAAPEMKRPQEPKPPFPYNSEEVTYPNPKASITLAGTLTTPKGEGRVPAALLITGSGPQDRDEMIFGHRPFLILADYLTRHGIAVLRVDDRGVGKSTGDRATGTSEDFAQDVLAGVEFLKGRKEIDPKRIGLIGHSEGGIIAPMVAARSSDIAFIVMMAGTGLKGEDILYLQAALIAKATGAPDSAIAAERKQQEEIFTIIKQDTNNVSAGEKLRKIITAAMNDPSAATPPDTAMTNKAVDMQLHQILSPWFRFFLTYDPKPALEKVTCPVLAINGEKDLQVPPLQNLPSIEAALKEGGNKHYTILKLPGLNHLFQTAETGSPTEYATIEETMSPLALSTISDWILKQMGQGGK